MTAAARRTFAPVRRNSYDRGEREHLIWRPLGENRAEARRFKGTLLKAAKNLEKSTKQPGRRMGALGLTGIAVLEALTGLADDLSGRLEPMIATIAEKAGLCARTVSRALNRLKEHGFIDWLRRTVTLDVDGAGPQVSQTSNAYWFPLRGRAAGLVRLIMGKAPPAAPDRDEVQAAITMERNARLRAMSSPTRVSAAHALTDQAREAVQRLKALRARRANDSGSKNPGGQG